jgi:hypothetical protein
VDGGLEGSGQRAVASDQWPVKANKLTMAERKPFEFFLLRYVPDAAREEFVNIGLVMTESGGDGGGFAGVHFTQDWRRARCLNPDVDVEVLDALGREIQRRVANVQDRALMVHEMMDRYSNAIQISPVRQVLAEDPVRQLKDLASSLIEMPWAPASVEQRKLPRTAGRKWIHRAMSAAFREAGVWDFLDKDVPASPYTNAADDFTIDFGYVTGKVLKFFHAVSLVDVGQETRMFPLRVAKINSKMATMRREVPKFTAVVEDNFDERNKDVRSVLAFMQAEEIQLARLREMTDFARQARIELLS